eukprot:m.13955 g.13955  ORF g.13955 m.13955 type:complete len:193 (-) comp8262_c0_seq1:61-639(-)
MLPAIRQRGDMSRGDTPAHQSMNSRESSHCAVESGHKSRRTSARSTGSPKIPVLKAGARRRSSRDRMTWLLPQELKESNHRLCKKKDHEGKFGSSTRRGGESRGTGGGNEGATAQRVVEATQTVLVKRRQYEATKQHTYNKHLCDPNEVKRQRREQLLEDTRQRMQTIKYERQRRQTSYIDVSVEDGDLRSS